MKVYDQRQGVKGFVVGLLALMDDPKSLDNPRESSDKVDAGCYVMLLLSGEQWLLCV